MASNKAFLACKDVALPLHARFRRSALVAMRVVRESCTEVGETVYGAPSVVPADRDGVSMGTRSAPTDDRYGAR